MGVGHGIVKHLTRSLMRVPFQALEWPQCSRCGLHAVSGWSKGRDAASSAQWVHYGDVRNRTECSEAKWQPGSDSQPRPATSRMHFTGRAAALSTQPPAPSAQPARLEERPQVLLGKPAGRAFAQSPAVSRPLSASYIPVPCHLHRGFFEVALQLLM